MMGLSLRNFWAIVFVVVALFLLAAVPAAEGSEVPAFTAVDDSTELIADTATDTAPSSPTPGRSSDCQSHPAG